MSDVPVQLLVASGGLFLGLVFGAVAQRTDFCTMGALSDWINLGDMKRLRAWLLAIAVAILGTQAIEAAGLVDLKRSIYLTPNFGWLGAIVGGALFGFGMTLAGGCGSKTLVRIGAGNLKSIVVFLVLAVSAYMTLRGLFQPPRGAFDAMSTLDLKARGLGGQGLPELVGRAGLGAGVARWLVTAIVAGGLAWFCVKDGAFRRSHHLPAGIAVGVIVTAGWVVTGIIGADEFDPQPLVSLTFVAPAGEALVYLMTFTGASINFGIASVFGVVLGAYMAAIAAGRFRLESFTDPGDTARHLVGGALMGVGGVAAMGCTIGQGLTGLSTLAMGSFLAFAGIAGGAVMGFKYLEEGSLGGALKALLARA
jgi:uncharacterized membrane protein YedE/YeeE